MSGAKSLLISISLIIVGISAYFLFVHQPETAVFERESIQEEEVDEEEITAPSQPSSSFIEILPEDCTKECSSFQNSGDQYAYCRSVCGLPLHTPDDPQAVSPTDPQLEKDLKQKDTAIKESDLSKCEEIKDAQLKKNCQVRVTEDLLE